ncbi:MAG: MBL fold metallo-hydrolase [Bacteroidales bacterium]|nr:MBL fold metallo-hydrolase [Bacteroidales bacterium]
MKITFLGTGTSQGVPVIGCRCAVCESLDSKDKRLRTSALIQVDDKNILIDIGPDFREQMLRSSVRHLDAILITHAHRDHVAGIDDIRPFNYYQKAPIDIYARDNAIVAIRRDYSYIFEKHIYPGLPEANLVEVSGKASFDVDNINIMPIEVMHKDLPILGYRIGDLTYITDANYISDQELEKLKDTKVLVINALRIETHFSHFSLSEALQIVNRIKPERAYLTHMSHEMGFYNEVSRSLPQNVFLAYDGLEIEV